MYTQEEQQQIIDDMSASIYNKERTYTEDELGKDAVWIEASKAVYKHFNGSDYVGTPEELAKEGLNIMGEFNYNMTFGTAAQTVKIQDADDYTKTAFYYMMDTYDKKDISSAGVGRAFKEMALDPLNYAMVIGTAGVGFFGKQAAGSAAKAALKEGLKQSAMRYMTNPVALGAVEGAAYTVADDYARQDAAVGAGYQEGYDPVQGAVAGAVGAGVGAGLVKATDVAVKGIGKGINKVIESGEEEMMKAAGGGTPPVINNTLTDDNALGGSYLKSKEGVPKGKTIYHPLRDKNYIYNEEEDKMYFKAGDKWIDMPNEDMKNDIRFINKNGVKAFEIKQRELDANIEESRRIEQEQYEKSKNDPNAWKDQHTAPTRDQDNATSIDDLTKIYPDDVYGSNAAKYYGHGDPGMDRTAINILQRIKGKPDATVTIYRAVPKDLNVDINKGDWVTISKQYAREHGENRFDGDYKILELKVKARDIITDGNSIHEQGYDPKGETNDTK